MRWLTDDELARALNSAGVPKNRKTIRQWPAKAPGISRLIASRRMFHPRLPELLLAGHDLRDIGTALAALENGASPNQLDLLPSPPNRRGKPADNEAA
jgi:hypothetical protein